MRTVAGWVALLVLAIASPWARAESGAFDFSVGTSTRSYPLSGVAEAEGGYSYPLWGTPRGPFGGYLRSHLFAASVLTYNSLEAGVEFFPLGIFGFRAGVEGVQNDKNYPSYDCAESQCIGRFLRPYLGMVATVGAGPYFARLALRRENWHLASGETVDRSRYPGGTFIEPTAGLVLSGDGDAQNIFNLSLGAKVTEQWKAILVLLAASSDSGGFSRTRLAGAVYQSEQGEWTVGGGLGTFESSAKPLGLTASFFVNWEIAPSLALH